MVFKIALAASQEEAVRWTAISQEKFLTDAESDRLTAYENGIQTGIQTGVANERKEIVQNLRTEGVSDEQIARLTRIPFEDVNKI
jgi:predicted transposase YdaD